jgi:hypothetical protein
VEYREVLEQVEYLADNMKRSDAVSKVYDCLHTQSVLFAYFAGNTIYLVSLRPVDACIWLRYDICFSGDVLIRRVFLLETIRASLACGPSD